MIAIIYHNADFDGKLSNEVCRFYLNKTISASDIHSYGWDYGQPLPILRNPTKWTDYDLIYIVDLSIPELMENPELRDRIVWIDHHKSAIEKYVGKKFSGLQLDGVAACRLCWYWFNNIPSDPTKQSFVNRLHDEPELIRLAGEYDVWDLRDPQVKWLQFGLRSLAEQDFNILVRSEFTNSYDHVLLPQVIETGRSIKNYCDRQNEAYAKDCAHTIVWEGITWCTLNIGQRGNSDLLFGGIKEEHEAGFAWRYTGKECYVSLYHLPNKTSLDLSVIATKYGGGGHRGACGFRCSIEQLAKIFSYK